MKMRTRKETEESQKTEVAAGRESTHCPSWKLEPFITRVTRAMHFFLFYAALARADVKKKESLVALLLSSVSPLQQPNF